MRSATPVLALDVAGRVGFAYGFPGHAPRCNSVALAMVGGDRAAYLWRLHNWLCDQITDLRPALVALEAPQTPRGRLAFTARRLISAAAVVELVCYAREIALVEAAPNTVRKHFLGKGNAPKDDVLPECERRGWIVPDADAADAAALFSWACETVVPRLRIEAAA